VVSRLSDKERATRVRLGSLPAEEFGFYAFALDGKKKVLSTASNVGQCLWSGIIAPERAGPMVKRPDEQGHVERLGNPDAVSGSSRVQSIQLPNRRSVAA
jgi:hypothetical protein